MSSGIKQKPNRAAIADAFLDALPQIEMLRLAFNNTVMHHSSALQRFTYLTFTMTLAIVKKSNLVHAATSAVQDLNAMPPQQIQRTMKSVHLSGFSSHSAPVAPDTSGLDADVTPYIVQIITYLGGSVPDRTCVCAGGHCLCVDDYVAAFVGLGMVILLVLLFVLGRNAGFAAGVSSS